MNATRKSSLESSERLLLNTKELQELLGCGRASAVDIGTAAQARVSKGSRVFWNRRRVVQYIEVISE